MAKKRNANRPKAGSDALDTVKPHPVFSKMTTAELKAVDIEAFTSQEGEKWKIELLQRKEPLNPELHQYLQATEELPMPILRHPLYVGPAFPDQAAYINWMIPYKQRMIDGLVAEEKWEQVVEHHATQFIDMVFRKYHKRFDDKTYWTLLPEVWTRQEKLWPNRKWFLERFQSSRPQRDHLMSAAEHRKLNSLPSSFTIYRGFIGKRGEGLSWSLDRAKALWFARRLSGLTHLGEPQLITGAVKKKDVLAYFNSRKEKEIIVDPATVRSLKVEPVSRRSKR